MIFVFKCAVLRKMRAYNLIELFKFITEDLEMSFQRKRLSLAFGKPQNLHLAARCFGRSANSIKSIAVDEKNQQKFHVPNREEESNHTYKVDLHSRDLYLSLGYERQRLPYQAAVALKFGTNNLNFIPKTAKETLNLATLAVGNNINLNVAQFVSLNQKESESYPLFYGDKEMEDDMQFLPTTTDSAGSPEMHKHADNINSVTNDTEHFPDEDISMEQIIQLHKQVSQDIEYKIRTSDNNFRFPLILSQVSSTGKYLQNVEGRHLLLHLPVLVNTFARIGIGIVCLCYPTVQELKYSQQSFPQENLALNLQLHSEVVTG